MHSPPAERYHSWVPHGFDLLDAKNTQKRVNLENRIRTIFYEANYKEISPPTFDYAATFQMTTRNAKYSPIFQLRTGTSEELAVRSDLTVQVIKAVANGRLGRCGKEEMRFSYLQPVFQDHPWGSAHKREILQAGVELINGENGNQKNDRVKEILQLARKCVEPEQIQPKVLYGDVRVIEYLLKMVPKNIRSELSLAFHNKDIAVIDTLCSKAKLDTYLTQIFKEIPLSFGDRQAVQKLKELCRSYPELCVLLDEASGIEDIIFDFSLVRELSYYTGSVFEAYASGTNEKIFTGGVYDSLFSEFSDEQYSYSACGFALNLTAILDLSNTKLS